MTAIRIAATVVGAAAGLALSVPLFTLVLARLSAHRDALTYADAYVNGYPHIAAARLASRRRNFV